ncbi:nucleolar protein,Nop52-domain-containing protein [Delphinella strobiligena]|nr:nucleolar protein,Nop52-domain-containing protein [Delphinella strobiligena]
MAATTQQSNPFIKQLAANDRKIRDRALTSLRSYLSRNTPFTSTDLLKLHKGLFYSMWSADKPRYQQALARDLASLCTVFTTSPNTLLFIRTFWQTMAREWTGIEALRMDKFLYLCRQYVSTGFALCVRNEWSDAEFRKEYLEILAEVPLAPREPKVPNGLRYHILDIYVDELDKADAERSAPLDIIDEVFGPLRKLGKESPTKSVRERVAEALEDERVGDWKGEKPENEDKDEDEDDEADGQKENDDENDGDGEFGGFDD